MRFSIASEPMPLYEYKCKKCGATFEILQKVDAPPLTKCIHCQGSVKKVLSPPALQFKGSGWYVTDYASKAGEASDPDHKEKQKKDKDKDATPKKKSPTPSSENTNS